MNVTADLTAFDRRHNWPGVIRALIYPVQFERDPVDGVDRVIRIVVDNKNLKLTRDQYRKCHPRSYGQHPVTARGSNGAWPTSHECAIVSIFTNLILGATVGLRRVAANHHARIDRNADDQLELLAAGSSLIVVSDLLAIPAAVLAMLFVRRVTNHQRRMAATPPVPAGTGF